MDKTNKEAWFGNRESLSPEALEKRRRINTKLMLFGCLPVFLFIGVALFFGFSGNESTSSSPKPEVSKGPTDVRYIPGLSPTDVYLNLEQRGFKTEKSFNSEFGNLWTSTHSVVGIDYRVEVFSYNIENVVSIKATAMVDANEKDIVATKQFFQLVSTLPYENASPEQAASWVDKNFNNNKATTQIGGVTFTMIAPTQYVRMLLIEAMPTKPLKE